MKLKFTRFQLLCWIHPLLFHQTNANVRYRWVWLEKWPTYDSPTQKIERILTMEPLHLALEGRPNSPSIQTFSSGPQWPYTEKVLYKDTSDDYHIFPVFTSKKESLFHTAGG